MAASIRILPVEVASRIAAGEVVERPASVVKELVENAIDAQATTITVDLHGKGITGIRVADDGEGMAQGDALLAFERHATSKLSDASDLFSVNTLGFRGEALPSIASVSKVRLITGVHGKVGCTEVTLEGGKVLGVRDVGAREGSIFEIDELFYNTPARKKFLRSDQTELSQAVEVVTQAALTHPQIHFRLSYDGRSVLDCPPAVALRDRILQVLGEKRFSSLIEGEFSFGKVKVVGYISQPTVTQGSRKNQLFFVNRRPIRHPSLVRAVYEAYETFLRKGEHPFFVLYITIDPTLIDVNVHPSKREVRFSDQIQIYPILRSGLHEILLQKGGTPLRSAWQDSVGAGKQSSLEETVSVRQDPGIPLQKSATGADRLRYSLPLTKDKMGREFREDAIEYGPEPPSLFNAPSLRAVGQVYDTFLLVEIEGELAIVDQHTAHERILYERLLQQIKNARLEVQPLLLPQEVSLTPSQCMLLPEFLPTLVGLGLEVDSSSQNTAWIRTIPALAIGADPGGLFFALMDEIEEMGKGAALSERIRLLAATLACHSAVRAGRALRLPEIDSLLADLSKTDAPYTCPHGRPVLIRYPKEELERQFHRR